MDRLKSFIKKHKVIVSLLYRVYLSAVFMRRSLSAYMIAKLVSLLKNLVLHGDIEGLTIMRNDTYLHFYGQKFHWNPFDRNSLLGMALTGSYERQELELMSKIIKPGMTVLDIGANYGLHSTYFAQKTGPKGHIYCFEPLKTTYEELCKNVVLNNFSDRITSENIGLSNKPGKTKIYVANALGTGAVSLKKRWSGINRTYECRLDTLDNYVSKHHVKKINFIKCDVEGAEYLVFQGAKKTLKTFKPIIFFEAIENHTKLFNYSVDEIMKYLQSLSYSIYEQRNGTLKEITANFGNGNYLAFYGNGKVKLYE